MSNAKSDANYRKTMLGVNPSGETQPLLVDEATGALLIKFSDPVTGENLFSADLTQDANRTHDQGLFDQTINDAGNWKWKVDDYEINFVPSQGRGYVTDGTNAWYFFPEHFEFSDGTNGAAYYMSTDPNTPWFEQNRSGENSVKWFTYPGDPNGNVVGSISSICVDTATPALYQKTGDDGGDTEWTLIGGSSGGGGTALVSVQGTGTTLPDSAFTTLINWGTTNINVGSCFDTSTGIFTAPEAGNYLFNAYCNINGFTTAGETRIISAWYVNSNQSYSVQPIVTGVLSGSYAYQVDAPVGVIMALAANDVVEFKVRQSAGVSFTTLSSAAASSFTVVKLG